MIHFIQGKPRGGKTLYAVKLIIAELVFGTRWVFTNVPLHLGELAEYIRKHYPNCQCDVASRVFILDDDKTKAFFLYRPGWCGKRLTKDEWQSGKLPDYTGITDKGVMYVIDEVHVFYGSRQWAEDGRGRDAMFYLSQHGHLGDTVVAVTQAVRNVDNSFRRIAQDFTIVRNMSKERLGLFRLPAIFIRRTFFSEPTDLTPAMETKTFTLDVSGIASCYSTAAGVGMHEAIDGDKGERARGFPWWVGVSAASLVLILFFTAIPRTLGKLFDYQPKKIVASQNTTPVKSNSVPHQAGVPALVKTTTIITNDYSTKVTGYAQFGGKLRVTLSDGRIETFSFQPAPPKTKVVIDGKSVELP